MLLHKKVFQIVKEIELNKNEIEQFKQVFSLFDKDHDGQIKANEIGDVFSSLGKNYTQSELECLVKKCDLNASGTITFNEFIVLMTDNQAEDSDKEIIEAFKMFDKKGKGSLSINDVKNVLSSLGESVNENDLNKFLKELDADGDHRISFEGNLLRIKWFLI